MEKSNAIKKPLVVTIHQPGYLPWLGFFEKMAKADVFVFLDDAQYEKNGFDNRNKIKTAEGWMWLTVPVKVSFGQKLNEVIIADNTAWQEKHWRAITINYSKAPYFSLVQPFLKKIYEGKFEKLIDLNLAWIFYLAEALGIKSKFIKSSDLKVRSVKSERIFEICQALNATTYLSGRFGKNYLREEEFIDNHIKIEYQDFQHPVYPQLYGDFLPAMAAIDLLCNCGPKSSSILSGN